MLSIDPKKWVVRRLDASETETMGPNPNGHGVILVCIPAPITVEIVCNAGGNLVFMELWSRGTLRYTPKNPELLEESLVLLGAFGLLP